MSVQDTLRSHDLFRNLTDGEVDRVSGFATVGRFKTGDTIYRHDAPATHVYLTLAGEVHLMLPALSRDFSLLISKLHRGDLFGVAPLLGNARYTAQAITHEPSEVLSILAEPLVTLLRGNPAAEADVLRHVARLYMTRYTEVMRNMQAMVSQIPLAR